MMFYPVKYWVFFSFVLCVGASASTPAAIAVDYPQSGSIFPPDFAAPTFLWRDPNSLAKTWRIDLTFDDGSPALRVAARGPGMRLDPIDPRCISATNQPPKLTPEQAAAHTWKPDGATWTAIKKHPAAHVIITGYSDANQNVSRGEVDILISRDPVGAPIFYRDVPLMPSEVEKGVIKPLATEAIPLIAWRLRNVSETSSRVLMTSIHSCANCHSVSRDGKTMGMDLDGPRNDKGLYALFDIKPQAAIREQNVVAWSTFQGKLGGKLRVGFMSQVSPDGQYVVTTINDPGPPLSVFERKRNPRDLISNYYVANFKDYRFLQVFYPTRGILAWYSRATGRLEHLPGADDSRYVHTDGVWSPDGKYLVFARAEAKDAYPEGAKVAEAANDPNERQIRYDLYRIPFNGGQGGKAEPIEGASQNGMSNSFPKVSPDGRWIVFVKARNGQLMRPDSQLYIVPAAGGEARRMRCNTPLMNSWHSFSPNGRWLVFSSKSWSPYTKMFLTHIDENGDDSPPILIEGSTASNRAVNIPEFVNIAPDGFQKIDAVVTDYYRIIDEAEGRLNKRQYDGAIASFEKALEQHPDDPLVHNSMGVALARSGKIDRAAEHYRKAIAISADYPDAHSNLGALLLASGRPQEAVPELEQAIQLNPEYAEAQSNLGAALAQLGNLDRALPHLRKAMELGPNDANARRNLALALAMSSDINGAVPLAEQAVKFSGGQNREMLGLLAELYAQSGRTADAARVKQRLGALGPPQPGARH
jgi:Tfp pilus assembly protein PilF